MAGLVHFNLFAQAAAGDEAARAAALPLLFDGLKAFFRAHGTVPMERCLGLPPPSARRAFALAERDYWLAVAHRLCDGATEWKRSQSLAVELQRFQAVIWPAWRDLDEPPPEASRLRSALFHAMHAAERAPTARGLPSMPTTARQLHELVKRFPSESSQDSADDGISETPEKEPK